MSALPVTAVVLKTTISLCPRCLDKIPATVIEREGQVWMDKECPEHGDFSALLASDPAQYFVADPAVESLGTCCGPGRHCGDQVANHSCNMLIELTQQCNLTCPTCYAGSSPHNTEYLPYEAFTARVDELLRQGKGDADLIQLSGGEPTLHPQMVDCVRYALNAGVKQVYINTNGIKLASPAFADSLAGFGDRLWIYLQFDGFEDETYRKLRGDPKLLVKKQRAIANCERLGIGVVPIMTFTRGVNDHEVGALLEMANASAGSIRKVMIHPAMYSGRYDNPRRQDRLTVADVAKTVSEQTGGLFQPEDFGPIPCSDPNCFSLAVALRTPSGLLPISRYFPHYRDWAKANNAEMIGHLTDTFDGASDLHSMVQWALTSGVLSQLDETTLDRLLDEVVAWQQSGGDETSWGGLFAIGVKPFMDAWTYDQDRIDKCCVHIISEDGQPVSFCEYNAVWRPQGRR